jgi:hypothetical protein
MVFVCGGLEAAVVLAQAKQTGRDEGTVVRQVWAIGALTLGLAIFADFVPEVAGPFALLVLVALAARSRGELGLLLGTRGTGSGGPGVQSQGATNAPDNRR